MSTKKNNAFTYFDSFEKANEADAKHAAALTPAQHLQNATERIKRMYADEFKKPMDKILHFKNTLNG